MADEKKVDSQIGAQLDEFLSNFYSEEAVQVIFECASLESLRVKRHREKGKKGAHPPFVKVGNRILYPKKEFNEWIAKRKGARAA